MSAQFFQRSVPAANTHIRSDNIVCDNVVQAKTVTMTDYRIRNGAVLTQLLNATQPVDAGLKDAVIINTQYWYNVTPTTNASFLITNFNCIRLLFLTTITRTISMELLGSLLK